MHARTIRSAPTEHLEDLAYLTAHLKADPAAKEFAADVEAESATLQTKIEDWNTKRHAVQQTQTELGNMYDTLLNAVRHAHDVILDDLRRNRRSPRFLTYFPRGLVAFAKASYLELVTDVRSLIQRCGQDPSPRIQEQVTLLQAADEMDAAFDRRAEAQANEGATYGELQIAKLQAVEACRRAAFHLAVIYPNEQARVRSYFRRVIRRPRSTAPAEGEGVPAAGEAATAMAAATASAATPVAPALMLT